MLKLGEVGNNSKDFEDFLSTKNTKLPLFLTQKWENYEFPIFGHHPNCKESHDFKKTIFFYQEFLFCLDTCVISNLQAKFNEEIECPVNTLSK